MSDVAHHMMRSAIRTLGNRGAGINDRDDQKIERCAGLIGISTRKARSYWRAEPSTKIDPRDFDIIADLLSRPGTEMERLNGQIAELKMLVSTILVSTTARQGERSYRDGGPVDRDVSVGFDGLCR